MNILYSNLEPFKTELLKVSTIHSLYLEQSGNPQGKPIISFHGGPGSQSKPDHRRFYDPKKYRIILFDQRGCGKSTPLGEIRENTTSKLVEDIEIIRKHLKINSWIVHGGSWGSTLALAYSEKYPQYVQALILRGVFTFRRWEIDWFTGNSPTSAKLFFPDKWESANKGINRNEDKSINEFLYDLYSGVNSEEQLKTIKSFNVWHRSLMKLIPDEKKLSEDVKENAIAGEKILYHFIKNNGFLKENELLENTHKIKHIPTAIIQGRYDMCCPPLTAFQLHKKLPNADFHLIQDAGHNADEPGIADKIIEYTNKFAKILI